VKSFRNDLAIKRQIVKSEKGVKSKREEGSGKRIFVGDIPPNESAGVTVVIE